jgi:methyl-accepting chemotaxis protein
MENAPVRTTMTITRKLFLGLGAIVALLVLVSAVAVLSLNRAGTELTQLVQIDTRAQSLAASVNTAMVSATSWERGILIRLLSDHDQLEMCNQGVRTEIAQVKTGLTELAGLAASPQEAGQVEELKSAIQAVEQFHEQYWAISQTMDATAAKNNLKYTGMPLINRTMALAAHMVSDQTKRMKTREREVSETVTHSRWILIVTILTALLVVGIVWYQVGGIEKTLRTMIGELADSSSQVGGASGQVAAASRILAEGSSEQAATLEETSASAEEVSAMAARNREHSHNAADLVRSSELKFESATKALDATVASMGALAASSGKISKIIKVIDEIAFQTNILALNAAVEAARAGESGMGFAVVADEVRNLAQRSAQAARDTTELIADSIQKSQDGKVRVDEVAAAIGAIAVQAKQVRELVDQVNLGSEEQARGIEQIATAMSQMGTVVQNSAASAEESSAAAQELNGQSETLSAAVARLETLVGRNNSTVDANPGRHGGDRVS